LRRYVQAEDPPAVGAMRVGCADEVESECVDALHRHFARHVLPDLKVDSKAVFRIANLGGRYQWGAVRIAEDHYALARGADDWKLLLVKLNAHVAIREGSGPPAFGMMERYGAESAYCGALSALLAGSGEPFEAAFVDDFGFEGVDRLTALREHVSPEYRQLFAALASARLQARRAMLDLQDHDPRTPTFYLVVPCVTINRRGHDTELVVGIYTADRRASGPRYEYFGLGDRPDRYGLEGSGGSLVVRDPEPRVPRPARDHRALARERWESAGRPGRVADPRLGQAFARSAGARGARAGAALGSLLPVLAELAPVPAAVLLFGHGIVPVHHVARAHRISAGEPALAPANDDARRMLADARGRIDTLSPERAEQALEELRAACS